MTVYVDELQRRPTRIRCFRRGSCHLTADSVGELHAFAERLGLRREWYQGRSVPHYDLSPAMRTRALRMGAVFVEARTQALERLRRRARR